MYQDLWIMIPKSTIESIVCTKFKSKQLEKCIKTLEIRKIWYNKIFLELVYN
jgi:hypothetical protein